MVTTEAEIASIIISDKRIDVGSSGAVGVGEDVGDGEGDGTAVGEGIVEGVGDEGAAVD